MPAADVPAGVPALIGRIAGAIRDELGAEIDAYPAFRDPDHADPLNRAFRAIVRMLQRAGGVPADRLAATTSRTLRRVATRRLAAEGWDDARTEALVESEPKSPDDWLAFLILSDRTQIGPLLEPDDA